MSAGKQAAPKRQPPPSAATARSAQPTREQIAQQVLGGFTGPIRRTRTPIGYQFAAMVVALLMILLPVIYLGLIALAAYGVYYHAVNHTGLMTSASIGGGRARLFAFLMYLGPIICGVVLIIFMIKPLFARPPGGGRTRSLKRESEPLLFAFVDRICDTVGAPQPKQIDVDCEVNASARFRRGMLSMLGSDLVLTIGMPLVAGLNTRQFGGVLAHEFGHFSQGFGMRLSYLIRSLSHWFTRLVYQRDAADEWLQRTADEWDIRIGWILYLAMGFVWLSRRVLWVLMYVGHFFGSVLLRQMEFDADRYETRLAGSGAFEQTARQLQALNIASQAAFGDLRAFYREGRLGDDLPRLIMSRVQEIPPEVKQAIDKQIATTKTGVFDTHPCDSDRIVAAKREDAEGVFRVELPATVLLADFDAQSKATTLEFYRGIFGAQLQKTELRPVAEIFAKRERERQGESALERFFQDEWSIAAPMSLDSFHLAPSNDPADILKQLKEVRQQMIEKAAAIRGAAKTLNAAIPLANQAHQLTYLLRANVKLKKQTLQEVGGPDGVKRLAAASQRDIEKATSQLTSYNQLAARRIVLALQLLYVPKVAARMAEPQPDEDEIGHLFDALQTLSGPMSSLAIVSQMHSSMGTLIEALQGGARQDDLFPVLKDLMDRLLPRAKAIRTGLQRSPYPYPHAKGKVTMSQYLMPDVPVKDDFASVFNSCGQVLESAPSLYIRLLGDLTNLVERVEAACRLPAPTTTTAETPATT